MPYKDPEKQREYKREWQKARQAGVSGTLAGTGGTLGTLPLQARTPEQILHLLEEQIHLLRVDRKIRAAERARVIAALVTLAHKVYDTHVLAARFEALEETMNRRRSA